MFDQFPCNELLNPAGGNSCPLPSGKLQAAPDAGQQPGNLGQCFKVLRYSNEFDNGFLCPGHISTRFLDNRFHSLLEKQPVCTVVLRQGITAAEIANCILNSDEQICHSSQCSFFNVTRACSHIADELRLLYGRISKSVYPYHVQHIAQGMQFISDR